MLRERVLGDNVRDKLPELGFGPCVYAAGSNRP